ncbi:MAG: outer membrane lipoprotein carrier protein LolA [Thermodesulfobacteriota bacterium]
MKHLRLPIFLALFIFCFIVIALGSFSAVAEESSLGLDDFLGRVEENSASISSFSCDFTQVRYLTIFPKPVQFSGRLSLAKPDKLRWEFVEPLPSVLVLNGKKGLKCSEGGPIREFNLDLDPVMRLVAGQLWAWTSGTYRDLKDDFDFELLPGPVLVFSPVTNGAASFISKIRVVFDPDLLQPLSVEIREPGGDRTVISFSGYQRDVDLPAALFTECRSR